MTIVHTVFGHDVDVDEHEAAALTRAGLVRDEPAPESEPAGPVTVVPVFTCEPLEVDQAEADALARAGLLVPPAETSEDDSQDGPQDSPAPAPVSPVDDQDDEETG